MTMAIAQQSSGMPSPTSSQDSNLPYTPKSESHDGGVAIALASISEHAALKLDGELQSNQTTAANRTADGTAPPVKRKPSRRANTAERRATHNAVERQRRETLNGRFLDLAQLLPSLSTLRRPSKSSIVNASIAFVNAARKHRTSAARELRAAKTEIDQLRRENNEWRARDGLPPLAEPIRGEGWDRVMRGEMEITPVEGLIGEEDEEDGDEEDGVYANGGMQTATTGSFQHSSAVHQQAAVPHPYLGYGPSPPSTGMSAVVPGSYDGAPHGHAFYDRAQGFGRPASAYFETGPNFFAAHPHVHHGSLPIHPQSSHLAQFSHGHPMTPGSVSHVGTPSVGIYTPPISAGSHFYPSPEQHISGHIHQHAPSALPPGPISVPSRAASAISGRIRSESNASSTQSSAVYGSPHSEIVLPQTNVPGAVPIPQSHKRLSINTDVGSGSNGTFNPVSWEELAMQQSARNLSGLSVMSPGGSTPAANTIGGGSLGSGVMYMMF